MKYKTIKELKKIDKISNEIWERADKEDFFEHRTGYSQVPTKTTMLFLHKIPKSFRTQVALCVNRKINGFCTRTSNESQRTFDLYPVIRWLKKHGNEMKSSDFKVKDKVRIIPRQANGKYVWSYYKPNDPDTLQSQDFKCEDGVVTAIDTERSDGEVFVHCRGDFGSFWYYAEELVLRKNKKEISDMMGQKEGKEYGNNMIFN